MRVELYIDVGDKKRNKKFFDSLKTRSKEIESQIGLSLKWDKLEERRASRISALISFRLAIATPEDVEEAQSWGLATMLKFIDVIQPLLKEL